MLTLGDSVGKRQRYICDSISYGGHWVPEFPLKASDTGSAGHEPAPAAFVGPSMLTTAVTNQSFALPATGQILAALRAARSPHGIFADHQELYGRFACTLVWPRV
ncbi:hypothetical protein BC938DRAFT_479286 [Jimgerdemannia flammicorona]|uniref:DhaK domain-containing protein n=1 Tax=Jimgerdemannia flammicorona TaxID=994334 RepID=A0A433QL80_9FUNG|nr:hypothetical protein BC938DRAFT_479286 [Jimgerdemannia flammicorona]